MLTVVANVTRTERVSAYVVPRNEDAGGARAVATPGAPGASTTRVHGWPSWIPACTVAATEDDGAELVT